MTTVSPQPVEAEPATGHEPDAGLNNRACKAMKQLVPASAMQGARIAVLAILLAMSPCAAQGQTWDGTTGGPINDHDQREDAQRKKLRATRPGTFTTLARAVRNDSRNAAEYDALAAQARALASEALQRAETARRLAAEASYMARIETPDRWWEAVEAQERAAEIWEQEAALWKQEAKAWNQAAEGGAMIHGVLRLCPLASPPGVDRNPRRSELCREVAMR